MDPAHRLSVDIESRNGVAHVSLDGEIDMSTVPALVSHLAPLGSNGVATIMLDLQNLAFIDPAGIHALLAFRDHATVSGRRLILVGATPAVRRVFDLTRTQDLLDEDDAPDVRGRITGGSSTEGQATPAYSHG